MATTYFNIPQSEIQHRISVLQSNLTERNIDGAFLFSTPELYYYTNLGTDGALYIPSEGNPTHYVKRNLDLGKEVSHIDDVRLFSTFSILFDVLENKKASNIAFELDILPFSLVKRLESENYEIIDGSTIFRTIRSRKSDLEIKHLQTAAKLVDESFEYCCEIATPEIREIDLTSRLDSWLLRNGHHGFISTRSFNSALLHYSYVISSSSSVLNIRFTPISGYGLSGKYPYGPSSRKLGKNPFFVDTCGNHFGYISDTTRTFICGKLDENTLQQIESLREIKNYLITNMKPDKNAGELFKEVFDLAEELGISNHFMGSKDDRSAFLGHGVGLELDELPVIYAKGHTLEKGNVIACEPKFYIKDRKVLGIEDTIAVKESKNDVLSQAPNYFEI